MSFFLTQPQLLAGTKTVTRRRGWTFLKPGDRFCAVRKGQGLKPGEKIERLAILECVSNRREPLEDIIHRHDGDAEAAREGFPDRTASGFAVMFCEHMGGDVTQAVSRIEFRVVEYLAGGSR